MRRLSSFWFGCILTLSALSSWADDGNNPCVADWQCDGVSSAPTISSTAGGPYQAIPGETIEIVFTYTISDGSKTMIDVRCDGGSREESISGTLEETTKTVNFTVPADISVAGPLEVPSPSVSGSYSGCGGSETVSGGGGTMATIDVCIPDWQCKGVKAAPIIYVSDTGGPYEGFPGDTVTVTFTYAINDGEMWYEDIACGQEDTERPLSGTLLAGSVTKSVSVTLSSQPYQEGQVAYVSSPTANGYYLDCEGEQIYISGGEGASATITIKQPDCTPEVELKWEVDGEIEEQQALPVATAFCNDGTPTREADLYYIYEQEFEWTRTVYSGAAGCPEPTSWELTGETRRGSYISQYKANYRPILVNGEPVVCSSGGGGGGDESDDQEICEDPAAPNHGEAFVYGEVTTPDPNQTIFIMALPASAAENVAPPQFILSIGHRIVTHNTPRERDLAGQLKLKLPVGQTMSDAFSIEVAVRDQDGELLQDINGEQIWIPYLVGDNVAVLERGHSGCGVHTGHSGVELFRFTMHRKEPLTLIAEVDPDGEPEGDGSPLKRIRIVFPVILTDSNRSGVIEYAGDGENSAVNPFRFWSNDDDDDGDEMNQTLLGGNSDEPGRLAGFWELDGRTPDYDDDQVDGRCDLADFFPVFLDIKTLLGVLPPGYSNVYKLKQADGALNFVYTDLTRQESRDYLHLNKERAIYGPAANYQPNVAPTHEITAAGVTLDAGFLDRIKTGTDKGVILIEGRQPTDKPLRLVVEKDGVEIAEVALHIKISPVEDMYRWLNLRGEVGQSETRPTIMINGAVAPPPAYPDSLTNGKMFIFVHGYNVDERQSRAWMAEGFKRMWQSGSRAMFTAVSWHGDYSQIADTVAPDYWDNITRAFKTAQHLAPVINGLPGSSKVIVGHSMGNVVVSSAISDWNMNVAQYFMLNAAVPLEAYDTAALSVASMRPNYWSQIDQRLWSTHWHDLFPSGDQRRKLTWFDRFIDVAGRTTAINYYSSQEDILNNNPIAGQLPPLGGEFAWITQEMTKGTRELPSLLTFDIQGGWAVDLSWYEEVPTSEGIIRVPRDVAYYNAITNDQAKVNPLFTHFQNEQLMDATNGSAAAADYVVRADALGGAIPALSFPAGRNQIPALGTTRNVNIALLRDGWARTDPRWRHSDAKNAAYYFNYKLWDNWVLTGDLK